MTLRRMVLNQQVLYRDSRQAFKRRRDPKIRENTGKKIARDINSCSSRYKDGHRFEEVIRLRSKSTAGRELDLE